MQNDLLSERDLNVLRDIRRLALDLADNASLLYWDTPYPNLIRGRFHSALKALSDISPYALETFAPETRTRYSWDGQTVTSHVEAV